MVDGKGKGRAVTDHDVDAGSTAGQSVQDPSSLLGRVTSSVQGLARSTLAVPSTAELPSDNSTVPSGSSKVERSSGSHSSAWVESCQAPRQSTPQNLQPQAHSSFREGHTKEHIWRNEIEFSSFLAGTDSFKPSFEAPTEEILIGIRAKDKSGIDFNSTMATQRDVHGICHYGSIQEYQEHDGNDVLAILTQPSNQDDEFDYLLPADEGVDWGLTDEQMLGLGHILKGLFPPAPEHKTPPANHPLNLIPTIASNETTQGPLNPIYSDREICAVQSSPVLSQNPERQVWIDHWEGVLNGYADEVWGGLLPIVVKAREEVEEIKTNPGKFPTEQSGALRRLQLVLDHLRNS